MTSGDETLTRRLRVAVIGAGINGVMSAWALARRGHRVEIFERAAPMAGTSSASTKLLHGGLRYLETGHVSLVRESLAERGWWLEQAPQHAHWLELLVPVEARRGRPRLLIKAGLTLYDLLSRERRLAPHRWLDRREVLARIPALNAARLRGAYAFWDGQMDDRALGLWATGQAIAAGAVVHERCEVRTIDTQGRVRLATRPGSAARLTFDAVCNVAGPHAGQLLERSGIESERRVRLLRGSHLLVDGSLPCGLLLQSPSDGRPCFVLPYQGRVLIGTTEVEQGPDDPIACSEAERDYLIAVYNAAFERGIGPADVRATFAGVRPLLAQRGEPNANTREHAFERSGRVITVFGGKWTTARRLGEQLAERVEAMD